MSPAAGPGPPRTFPREEFEGRLARAQAAMRAAGIDALLATTEADVRWFTGFLTAFWQSPTRPWFVVVPAAGAPIAVIPTIGEIAMRRTWLDDVRTWSSPDPDDDGVTLLADTIVELAGAAPRVAAPMGPGTHLRMPLADFARLRGTLAGADWVDATGLVAGLRAIKSPREVALVRHACAAASRAFAAVPELVRPGTTDVDAFRAFRIRCLEEGADDVDYLVGAASPGGYADIISPPSGRRLARGDVLILDVGASFAGHFCDFDRNWAIGEADAATRHAYDVAWRATAAGLEAARPGTTCAALFETMRSVIEPHEHRAGGGAGGGAGGAGRLGHGLGTELTEPPSLTERDGTVLEAGMIITLEPGYAYAPDRLMVHEENVLITDDGCELLTERAPRELSVIDWPNRSDGRDGAGR